MLRKTFVFISLIIMLASCSSTKYLQDNETLLNKVKIKNNDTKLSNSDLKAFLRQKPNTLMLGIMKFRLGAYSLSGSDTTMFINRMLRNIGEPPVAFDSTLIYDSELALQRALVNKGYLNAEVTSNLSTKRRKSNISFVVNSGDMYKIRYFSFDIDNDSILSTLNRHYTINSLEGQAFDIDNLNELRNNIALLFRRNGYYHVQKDIFAFEADTAELNRNVDLKLVLNQQFADSTQFAERFTQKHIDKVTIYCYEELDPSEISPDTIEFGGYTIIYNSKRQIFYPRFLIEKVFIESNQLYNEQTVNRTISNFNTISAIKYVNISFTEKDGDLLDCSVFLLPSEKYSYSIGLEANTNSRATVGAAVNAGFTDKNIFRRAETFKVDGRLSYDLFRSNQGEFSHSFSAGGDVSLLVPKLLFPYFKEDFRLRHGANTRFSTNYTYQTHPDFQRSVLNTTAGYQWQSRRSQYGVDVFDFSYIKVDSISEAFLLYNPNLRPTFEDHLVLKTVFTYSTSNRRQASARDFYTFRGRLSVGGNTFYLANLIFNQTKVDGKYKVFGTHFSQFVKADMDLSYNTYISENFRIVYHAMFGIGVPYFNATILPFEERFFAGGSNSMRGWNARTLGPGTYYSTTNSYLSQNGDIKLELNAEARFKLFWVLEGALFIDAGNIWTIRKYDNMEGSEFLLDNNKFISDIALNYGFGLRFDFDYFLIRFDFGLKLYDPRYPTQEERWAISSKYGGGAANRIDPLGAIQFAIGYPF